MDQLGDCSQMTYKLGDRVTIRKDHTSPELIGYKGVVIRVTGDFTKKDGLPAKRMDCPYLVSVLEHRLGILCRWYSEKELGPV
jgi:hypothetical protein